MTEQVRVINPDGGGESTVSSKAYALIYGPAGYELVDPSSYTPPPPPEMPPALNDHMAEDILSGFNAKPLEPVQTAPKRARK